MTTLPESLLLLALNDDKGTVYMAALTGLEFGLAGAMIAELAARGRLRVDGKKVFVDDRSALDQRLLNDAVTAITDKPGKKIDWWVHHLSRAVGGLRQRLLDDMVGSGTLERRDERVLLLFHHDVFPERNGRVEHDIRQRLDAVLLHGEAPDERTRWLIELASACRVIDAIYPRKQRAAAKSRIKALSKEPRDVASSAVAKAIEAEQAAVMTAIIAASVVATSAATTSACSAGSAGC